MAEAQESIVKWGPRKIGAEQFEKQQANATQETAAGVVFGSRKGGGTVAPPPEVDPEAGKTVANPDNPPPSDAKEVDPNPNNEVNPDKKPTIEANPFLDEEGARVPIKTVTALLEADVTLFDQAFSTEMADGEPRVGVVKLLTAIEKDQTEPREAVLKVLAGTAGGE